MIFSMGMLITIIGGIGLMLIPIPRMPLIQMFLLSVTLMGIGFMWGAFLQEKFGNKK